MLRAVVAALGVVVAGALVFTATVESDGDRGGWFAYPQPEPGRGERITVGFTEEASEADMGEALSEIAQDPAVANVEPFFDDHRVVVHLDPGTTPDARRRLMDDLISIPYVEDVTMLE